MNGIVLSKDYEPFPPYIWAGDYLSILKHGGDFPLINQLKDLLTGRFRLKVKLTKIYSNFYVNSKARLVRKNKFAPITLWNDTKLIEGTDLGYGGSNSYPHPAFKQGYCVLEIITDGFPHLDLKTYEMNVEILEIEKLML